MRAVHPGRRRGRGRGGGRRAAGGYRGQARRYRRGHMLHGRLKIENIMDILTPPVCCAYGRRAACQKSLAEFRVRRREINIIRFLLRHVRGRKHFTRSERRIVRYQRTTEAQNAAKLSRKSGEATFSTVSTPPVCCAYGRRGVFAGEESLRLGLRRATSLCKGGKGAMKSCNAIR